MSIILQFRPRPASGVHPARLTAADLYFKPEWWDSAFALGLETLLAGIARGGAATS